METAVGSEVAQELYTELEEEVYNELEHFVADPAFCAALERKPGANPTQASLLGRLGLLGRGSRAPQVTELSSTAAASTSVPLLQQDEQQAEQEDVHARASGSGSAEGQDKDAQQDGFIVVDKHDAVECLAYYIAACIQDLPEAQALTPRQLQVALMDAMRSLKRSRFQRVCSWGRSVYCWSTYTYSAVQMYQNPWLMRALLTALWAASRVSLRLLL